LKNTVFYQILHIGKNAIHIDKFNLVMAFFLYVIKKAESSPSESSNVKNHNNQQRSNYHGLDRFH